ncbi:MAG: DinB family protein [Candidatus Sulfotelmatobacter sp.]
MKRILVTSLFISVFICAFAGSEQAQTMAPSSSAAAMAAPQAPVKDPVTAGLRVLLPRSRNNTLGAITAMPADKFSYKPTPDQMSFAHLVVHIIGFNNGFCAKAADVVAPKVEEAKESDSKDKLLAAATASYDFCADALGKMDDSKLGDTIELFGGRQAPRAMADLILASGWADHYAAAAMYLRLNGVLPPSAQPKK